MIVKFRDFLDEKWSFGGHVEKKKKRKKKIQGTRNVSEAFILHGQS